MAKRFKLKFTIPSFQMCRSKTLSNFPGNPVPAVYRLSPVNPKAHDVGYPNLPASPPSTPEHKITCRSRSRASNQHVVPFNCCTNSPVCESTFCKIGTDKGKKMKARACVPSRRSSFLLDNEEESDSLISCMTSFSDDFCHDESLVQKAEKDQLISRHRKKISSVKKVERVGFQASKNRRQMKQTAVMSRTSMTRCTVEGKVKESFAVVKKSNDPYEDFKKSMMEMITEMEMSEAEDMEQLLQCFLALNSRSYHGVIVRAFMEIWQQLFFVNLASSKTLNTDMKIEGEE